jgi:Ni,Fe-hydrogenase III large subunit/Ni,Fe-hydrogenase III component G
MTGVLDRVERSLALTFGDQARGVRRVRDRELHCRVAATRLPELATLLRLEGAAELRLMVGEDRRADLGGFAVHYLFASDVEDAFVHVTTVVDAARPQIPSLATLHYPASRFEREIRDLFGIEATDHPDPRPLVRHAFWPDDYHPLRKDAVPRAFVDDGRPFPFQEVAGEGVYEIPVGPVHAGIIEPGHFRFSVMGETIIDMKSRLYFTHKGTEKLFEGRTPAEGVRLAERISGDTTAGHALAYCEAIEALAGVEAPPRARGLRLVVLELERLYNHVGDIGMILNDTGYGVAHAHCFRIRERLLRLNKALTGSRLLRGAVVPGGVACDTAPGLDVAREVEAAVADFQEIVTLSLQNTLVMDRLEGTGRLITRTARDHGVLGFVARASGIDTDARRDHPCTTYRGVPVRVPVFHTGDVHARALVRIEEAHESAALITRTLSTLPGGPLRIPLPPLPGREPAFAMVEAWRGAILHWLTTDDDGRLARVKVCDPSFLNWPPLSYALLGNIVPDFPLCNKSFNQSYSGNDL